MDTIPIFSNEECVNLEEYFLLWINISLEEFNTIQSRLRSSFNHQKLFHHESHCEEYISHHVSKDDRIVFIINNTNICQKFLLRIQQLRQVSSIYVRCSDDIDGEELNKIWSKQFTKIGGVFTEIDKLITKIEFDQNQRRNQGIDTALAFNVFNIDNNNNTDRSSGDLNAEFLHSLLIMDVLLRMKKLPINSNKELIDLCKNAYKDNLTELLHIENFDRTYKPNQALWWYTSDTFLFRILNKAFRVDNTNILYLFRSFIYDLYIQLEQYQCKSCIRVYRGQLITSEELDHLQSLIGRYISNKSFFSTTLEQSLAIFYLGSSRDSTSNLKRILFDINADPEIDGIKPFAKIASFSAFPNEEEVLFMPRSIFQIVDISFDQENHMWIIQMVLCSEKQNHLKQIYEQNRKNYGGGRQKETNPMTLGNVLQRMGKNDDAEMFYRRQLNEMSVENLDDPLISACYFNIAEVLREKGQYDASIMWYQKSLDTDIEKLPEGHPNIGNTYNSIGIVQEKRGDYESALDSYSIALKIALQTFGWNNTRVALCLNNTGNAYQALDNHLEALDCHRIALMIRQNNLPPDHHRLAASHNNIAVVYHRLGHFDLAYEHYKVAFQIDRKSLLPDHSDISLIARNIALLRESEGNLKQALAEFEQEAKRRRQVLQCNHPDIAEIEEDIKRIKNQLL